MFKNNILLSLIFVAYACLTFIVGLTHEPWLDEAQSWLIARDCSFYDIMFTRCSYEGTPFLWFYILKVFILFGLKYEYIFVASWIFACIGTYLFLFKTNVSTIFKILIPFTFYIFYQYSIIARPYCLIFPVLCLIAVFYNKRLENPFLYCGLLVLCASIHAYAYVIAFILFCFYIYDEFMKYFVYSAVQKCTMYNVQCTINDKTTKNNFSMSSLRGDLSTKQSSVRSAVIADSDPQSMLNKTPFSSSNHPIIKSSILPLSRRFSASQLISLSAAILSFSFIAFISMKNPDCDYVQKNIFLSSIAEKLLTALLRGYFNLNSFFSFFSALLLTLSLYYLSVKTFCKNKRQLFLFLALNLSVYISIVLVNFYDWHLGIIPITLFFSCLILKNENNITISLKENTLFYVICVIVICTQMFFSVKNSYLEFYNEYDGASTVAKYLKQNNFGKEDIIALGCRAIAVQPYFKENIYMNKNTTYYHWSKKGFLEEIERSKKMLDKAKVFITDEDMIKAVLYEDIMDYISENCKQGFVIESDMYIKGIKFNSATKYYVFIK